jgi:hypothetical protein
MLYRHGISVALQLEYKIHFQVFEEKAIFSLQPIRWNFKNSSRVFSSSGS